MRKNRNNHYREQLMLFLDSDNMIAMMDWIKDQRDLDQPDILRELRDLLIEQHEKTGEKDCLEIAIYIEGWVDQFEEEILDNKLHEQMFLMEFDKIDIDQEKFTILMTLVRKAIIEAILSDSEYNEELWKIAEKAIKTEKKSGLYDPNNWRTIY